MRSGAGAGVAVTTAGRGGNGGDERTIPDIL